MWVVVCPVDQGALRECGTEGGAKGGQSLGRGIFCPIILLVNVTESMSSLPTRCHKAVTLARRSSQVRSPG